MPAQITEDELQQLRQQSAVLRSALPLYDRLTVIADALLAARAGLDALPDPHPNPAIERAYRRARRKTTAALKHLQAAQVLALTASDADAQQTPDALTGLLTNVVAEQSGRCLICAERGALYCGLDCASRGR